MYKVDKNYQTRSIIGNGVLSLEDVMADEETFIVTDTIIALRGEITPASSSKIVDYIIAANYPPDGVELMDSLTIMINSRGGCLESTFSMISAIRSSAIPITTVSIGACMSGGLMTAISGKRRLVDKYCSVMSHTLSTGYPEHAKHADLEIWLKDVKAHTKKIVDLYEEYTGLDRDTIKKCLLPKNGEVYLTAKQSLEYGLFDDYFTSLAQLKNG